MRALAKIVASLSGPVRRNLLRLLIRVGGPARQIAAVACAERVAAGIRVDAEGGTDALKILLFNGERFREDGAVLADTGAIRLLQMPKQPMQEINGLLRTAPKDAPADAYKYFLENDQALLDNRKRLAAFVAEVLTALRRLHPFDCCVTPAIHYRGDYPWAAAADSIGIPFVALHKEFTIIDQRHLQERIDIYRDTAQRFPGSWVLVTNESARIIFSEGGIIDPERIVITGLPRMDRLFRKDGPFAQREGSGRQVTLFSFGHYCGGLGVSVPRRSKVFSANDDEGFVELFDETHAAIARLVEAHPDVTFKIKPRLVEDWWKAEIDRVFRDAIGKTTDELPNCEITGEMAPALMKESDAVIGFNSTVLLESLALGRPTIMPYFAEARDKYPYNVYLHDYVDAFAPAGSGAALAEKVEQALAGEPISGMPSEERKRRCLTYYLGYDDGRCAERAVRELKRVVALYREHGNRLPPEALKRESAAA